MQGFMLGKSFLLQTTYFEVCSEPWLLALLPGGKVCKGRLSLRYSVRNAEVCKVSKQGNAFLPPRHLKTWLLAMLAGGKVCEEWNGILTTKALNNLVAS